MRQYRHVVTPLVFLEMHAALMHCSGMADAMLSERAETDQLEGGVFEVADRDLNEVPPYQNDAFMNHVRDLATFERVRAARPAYERAATVMAQGRDWAAGEHP